MVNESEISDDIISKLNFCIQPMNFKMDHKINSKIEIAVPEDQEIS